MKNDNPHKENDLPDTTTQVRGTVKSFLLSTPIGVQKLENVTFPSAVKEPNFPLVEEESPFISTEQEDKNILGLSGLFTTEFERDIMITDTTTSPPENQTPIPATTENGSVETTEKPENLRPEAEQIDPEKNIQATIEKRSARITEAHHLVRKYTLGAMAVGVIPLPVVDLAVLTGLQLDMLHSLSQRYEIPFSRDLAKSILSVLMSDTLVFVTATPVASLIKIVPILGQISGTISMVTLGGAATYATGKVFIQHFESGGNFLDFDPEKAKTHFQALYKEGQQLAV